jgi:glutaredoxin
MHRAVSSSLLALSALMLVSPAWALYKVVGPDGRVTYTDRPPTDRPAQALRTNGAAVSTDGLPYELQRVVTRYPVSLFTGPKCAPCDAARQMLKQRGVPFIEKSVTSADDVRAYAKQEGTDQLPSVRIGSKQMLGYNQAEWTSYIDAAGYPAKSALPLNYRWPEPAPMAGAPAASKPAASEPARAVPPADNVAPPAGSSPSGFRF